VAEVRYVQLVCVGVNMRGEDGEREIGEGGGEGDNSETALISYVNRKITCTQLLAHTTAP
jgi:hypothetical protein